jgi:hypothetical protein
MATQTTTAPPVQISVVLDSGMFLNELYNESYPNCRIGYFAPEFRIYANGESTPGPDLNKAPMDSRVIQVRLIGADGEEKKDGVRISADLRNHILLKDTIYEDAGFSPAPIETRFDWIFNFNSGFFRCSSVKNRYFKKIDGCTHQPNGERQEFLEIAHDVVIHYDLEAGERLELAVGDQVLWTTSDYNGKVAARRFDIEVIAPHATAENYFRDALDHKGNDYWVPNQGDPDPVGGRP